MNGCRCDLHVAERQAARVLAQLRLRGLYLHVRDRLLWVAPRRCITDADRAAITRHRGALLALVDGERRN